MSAKMHMLKAVVSERLTQVAEEICCLVEKILLEYEQDLYREITPHMDLHTTTTGVSLQRFTGGLVVVESCDDSPKRKRDVSDPEEEAQPPRPGPAVKEERDDEWSAAGSGNREPRDPPQRHEKDTEVIKFIYSPFCKSEQLNTEPASLPDTEGAQHTAPPPEDAVPCTSTEPCGAAVTAALCLPADFQTLTEPRADVEVKLAAAAAAADRAVAAVAPPQRQRRRLVLCKACKLSFADRGAMMDHAKVHADDRVRKCGICGKLQPSRKRLLEHLQTHVHVCECCGKTFIRQVDLSVHMRCHTGEKLFTCKVCGIGFCRKGAVEIHMRTHETPYSCSVCGKCFTRAYNLIQHSVPACTRARVHAAVAK